MSKLINGEEVVYERWARHDLDMEERLGNRTPKEDRPPTVTRGTKVFVVQRYNLDGVPHYNFYHRGKIYHGAESLFSDVPLDAPPSTALGVRTAEAKA